ncbi:nucleoside 2-deoxyribosyltransferase domain-containing protein [Acanthopleuribacter pedis]|uniref:Nucleoside 2-deoxyribosyltransferase domain-containing protein n=1 Tax=Acanthopleuribacter pedis TaxID=442870 RepID=A0A8J7Q3B4_9BACT|nr:nucleoside 2-deoxyribosyltransferase domain-containing protein [Acanthopleuribacter pedis]MBO1318629.1 nucleoside 2-deoxyribosyltransferase domain-containing protein [Acanthopleuribacter pedis]
MATIIQSPAPFAASPQPRVFLAGAIDNGAAENWQAQVCRELADLPITLLNPRRDDWDHTWRNSAADPRFREQVTWELDALEAADHILMVFTAAGKAPITLLELGLHARRGSLTLVCPPAYWRHGNVALVAERFGLPRFDSLPMGIAALRNRLAG